NHARAIDSIIDPRRRDDGAIQGDGQEVVDVVSGEGAESGDGVALHLEVDLGSSCLVIANADLAWVQVFAAEDGFAAELGRIECGAFLNRRLARIPELQVASFEQGVNGIELVAAIEAGQFHGDAGLSIARLDTNTRLVD